MKTLEGEGPHPRGDSLKLAWCFVERGNIMWTLDWGPWEVINGCLVVALEKINCT